MTTQQIAPHILFEDAHLLILDKPAGLLSQGERTGDENLVDWLRQYLGRPYVGLVHRLDRNTSGIMVVGKRTKSARRLTDALQEGRLERVYLAWLEGTLAGPAHWRHFLKKNESLNRVTVFKTETAGAKEAVLTATPKASGIWRGSPVTLTELKLETGRSHQIRAQASHERHPLVGDAKYGSRLEFGRPALHSSRIRFEHPVGGKLMEFTAVLPPDMAAVPITPLSGSPAGSSL